MTPDARLLRRVGWLIGLRWLAAAGVVAASTFAFHFLNVSIALLPLQILGLIILAYNIAFRAWLRRIRKKPTDRRRRALTICTNAQVTLDLIALALVVHYTGGIESPLAFFFVFHMIIAGMILSNEAAYAQATLVLVLYGAVVLLEGAQRIPHYHLGLGSAPDMFRSVNTWPVFAVTVTTLYVVTYLTTTVAGELRRREQELADLTEELGEQAGACRLAYSELEIIQRRQLEYMRRIAHELKSPLSAISMLLRTILDGLSGHISDKARQTIRRAQSRSSGALELTQDLLTLSRLKEHLPSEEIDDVSLAHLIENVVDEEELVAESRGVRLLVDIDGVLPLVSGYRSELVDLLRNLVSNAVKYSPDGGDVTLRAYAESGHVCVDVADHGIGMSEEDMERLFDEFFRTPAARKSGIAGTGLGLPIVKSIVEHHKGDISVESRLDEGTTFSVRLPTADSVGRLGRP